MGRTGRFEVSAVIQTRNNDGRKKTTDEIILHSKQKNGKSLGQRFVRTHEEQKAIVQKIDDILLGKLV